MPDLIGDGAPQAASGHVMTLSPGATRAEVDYWENGRASFGEPWSLRMLGCLHSAPMGVEFLMAQLHADMPSVAAYNPPMALYVINAWARVVIRHHMASPFVRAAVQSVTVVEGIDVGRLRQITISGKLGQDGECVVSVDGVTVGHYSGPFGYADSKPCYARAGLYCWNGRSAPIVASVASEWRR